MTVKGLIQDAERPQNQLIESTDLPSNSPIESPIEKVMSGEGTTNLPSTTDVVGRMENNLVPSHTIDLISKLPLHILHHILGFLLAKDAARVAVLSKTWYQVWDMLPFLDFGGKLNRTDMLPYVDSILSHRKNQGLGVHKFRFGSGKDLQSYLDPWIKILKDLQIHDLSLRYSKSMNQCAELPENLSSVKSMVSLELNGFHLDSFRGVDIINWPSLRKLHLSRMLLNDDVIHNIVTNCYAIEDLRFEVCYGLNVITISSLVKLQKFEMVCSTEYPKVEINIPSLRSFRYVDAKMEGCFQIKACTMLKKLAFAGDFITCNDPPSITSENTTTNSITNQSKANEKEAEIITYTRRKKMSVPVIRLMWGEEIDDRSESPLKEVRNKVEFEEDNQYSVNTVKCLPLNPNPQILATKGPDDCHVSQYCISEEGSKGLYESTNLASEKGSNPPEESKRNDSDNPITHSSIGPRAQPPRPGIIKPNKDLILGSNPTP